MRQRILVVDDDPSLAEMLTIVLRGEGFDTAVVGDGTQALTAVRELRPDLVLLDLMLPGMDGLEVCRRLKANPATQMIKMLGITGYPHLIPRLMAAGADACLTKPLALCHMQQELECLLASLEVLW